MTPIENMKRYRPLYAGAILLVGLMATVVFFAADTLGVFVRILTRDPYSSAGVPPYYAYISLLGSAVWLVSGSSTLAVILFAGRTFGARMSDDSAFRIVVIGGATALVMAVDDILLFHDVFAAAIGLPERAGRHESGELEISTS